MDDDEKDNEQQRRKSSRTTAGKDTRKKYADDTELQQQLARPPTNGNREAIQWNTNISKVSGCDMENGEVMTALESACKRVRSRTSGVTQRQRIHKIQEQHEHVVYTLRLSIYVYYIYYGRSHLYYSFCTDNFCGLISMMCSQPTFNTISQQLARLLLSTQFLWICLFIAVIMHRCRSSSTTCSLSSAGSLHG